MIVVLGASGKTGMAVVQALLGARRPVRVVVRSGERAASFRTRGAEALVADLADASSLTRALEGASAVYALVPEDLSVPAIAVHRERMAEALGRGVRQSGVRRVVLLSALAACLPEGNGPARALHIAENALRSTQCRLTILRATYFQENVWNVLGAARGGIYPSFLPLDLPIPMIAATDVAQFAARELVEDSDRSDIVDLLGPAYSATQVAEQLSKALHRPVQPVAIPRAAQVSALTEAGVPAEFAESLAELYRAFASAAVQPRGDRTLLGTTQLATTIARALR